MLSVKNIEKWYGNLKAVDNISFDVNEGEIFGLLGLNGAGKTTTFRMIMGLLDDYNGEITLSGKKIDYSVTDKIGFLTEERSLLMKMRVDNQIKYYAILKGMKESVIEKRMDYWLSRFGLMECKYKKIKELSKGNQQKIQFITAIIHEPKLLILDEPFSGLDPINVELFKEVILELKKKKTIIIFSSHRMEHVELFCEKLLILVKGKCVLDGNIKDIKRDFKSKNIIVAGQFDIDKVSNINGVKEIVNNKDYYVIKIIDDSIVPLVFNVIKKSKNITKFMVEDPSLNEIFIAKVGEAYEE